MKFDRLVLVRVEMKFEFPDGAGADADGDGDRDRSDYRPINVLRDFLSTVETKKKLPCIDCLDVGCMYVSGSEWKGATVSSFVSLSG